MQSHRVVTSVDKEDDKELQRAADHLSAGLKPSLCGSVGRFACCAPGKQSSWQKLSLVFAKCVCWDMFKTAQYKSLVGAL